MELPVSKRILFSDLALATKLVDEQKERENFAAAFQIMKNSTKTHGEKPSVSHGSILAKSSTSGNKLNVKRFRTPMSATAWCCDLKLNKYVIRAPALQQLFGY